MNYRYPIVRYFAYQHLPEQLQEVSKPFHDMAVKIDGHPGDTNPEVAAGLRKLLEAKDCVVRGVGVRSA